MTDNDPGDSRPRPAPNRLLELSPGQRLGRYEILGEIGHGGIASFYLVCVVVLLRVVALKVLPLSLMPVWNSSSYFFVTLFAYLIMKEKPNRKKLIGLGVILVGIVIFSLPL